ncbi:mucoidy inhibitor MuiA family protein [Methylocella sp. CPCC 101449]|uniref:mucoidy inhibitor MuiA family protein n=1 Tax=Methylocella sp. CPCC 101449 TaxID=2987531 RepID=UPI00288C97BD|nr:mucoidy inhibitor MuiA family protein [Methylocella sp. CPCC 101449]MDT2020937.1 mucoidy inhibitor MuiA family protein [Methylocella sp. CPCC 101449]
MPSRPQIIALASAPTPFRKSTILSIVSLPALLAAAPAFAASFDATSKIDAVTVYPDAASIIRHASIELPAGTHTLVFRGLPMNLDPASLRIEGESDGKLSIGSVESRVAPADNAQADSAIAEQLRKLRNDRDIKQTMIDTLGAKRDMISRYAQASPEKLGGDSAPLEIDKWNAAWDAVGSAMGKINEELRVARNDLRDLDDKIKAVENSTRAPDARTRPLREVTVELEAGSALKGKMILSYRVNGASWRPLYDAQLTTDAKGGKASLDLVRRALISQRTGEDWKGVTLSVSTARVNRGTRAPDMQTQRLAFWEPPVIMSRPAPAPRANAPLQAEALQQSTDESRLRKKAEEVESNLDTGAFEAAFRVPGRIDIQGDGSQRSLRIASKSVAADVLIRTTPALDQSAYLDVSFVNEDEAPLLPGEVALQRDGAFVGRGQFGLIAQGETTRLGFGIDDRVKVSRVPVRRRENEPTWLGSTKVETLEFRTVVKNLHDFPIKVSVIDQIPISENSAIVIDQLPATTPPTDKIVEDRRGVMGWTFDLAPAASKEIKLAYRMKWPADRAVAFDTVPNTPDPSKSMR